MVIEVKRLGFSFSPSLNSPKVFTLKERDGLLQQLGGKNICIEYQADIDGPQTAARLIKEALQTQGVIFKDLEDGVHSYVWIQAGSTQMQFVFVVADPSDKNNYLCYECGPRELTASIMLAIYNFFYGAAEQTKATQTAEKIQTMLSSLDMAKQKSIRDAEDEIVRCGEQYLDALIVSSNDCNREITAAAIAQDWKRAREGMKTLERRIRVLGRIGSSKAIPTILGALGDSALTVAAAKKDIDFLFDNPNPFFRHNQIALGVPYDLELNKKVAGSLNKTSIKALTMIGQPAALEIRKHLDESSPPIRKALRKALKKIEKKCWRFWKQNLIA